MVRISERNTKQKGLFCFYFRTKVPYYRVIASSRGQASVLTRTSVSPHEDKCPSSRGQASVLTMAERRLQRQRGPVHRMASPRCKENYLCMTGNASNRHRRPASVGKFGKEFNTYKADVPLLVVRAEGLYGN